MRSAGERIKHPKRRGEWAEMCFALRAMEEGLVVSKPWGEMTHYDCIVEYQGHCVRVQVKSTTFKDRGGYSCSMRGSQGPYKSNAFDYVAAYVIPINSWYIVPERMVRGQGSIAVYPTLAKCKYGPYREAWELLKVRGPVAGKIELLMGCAEESMQ
jgi:hypothetical protein